MSNMRPIVFRARSKETSEWVEGNYFHNFRKGEFHAIVDFKTNENTMIYRESLEMKNYEDKFERV